MKPLRQLIDVLARKHRVFGDIEQPCSCCSDGHNCGHLCREDVESTREIPNTRLCCRHSRCNAPAECAGENGTFLEAMIQLSHLGFGLCDGSLLTQEIALRTAIGRTVRAIVFLGRLQNSRKNLFFLPLNIQLAVDRLMAHLDLIQFRPHTIEFGKVGIEFQMDVVCLAVQPCNGI